MGYIHPAVSEICDPQIRDPICAKFDKFLSHGQAHKGQMGKWPCTTRGLDNSTELRMEKIRQAVTEIWVPQVWQPPARTVTTIPLQPGGLRGKNHTKNRVYNKIQDLCWVSCSPTFEPNLMPVITKKSTNVISDQLIKCFIHIYAHI